MKYEVSVKIANTNDLVEFEIFAENDAEIVKAIESRFPDAYLSHVSVDEKYAEVIAKIEFLEG